jgi:hypothetical protein
MLGVARFSTRAHRECLVSGRNSGVEVLALF